MTISVGVSYNKIFAKLGSDMKKPDATTVITQDNYKNIVWPLPASDLLFVGPATTRKLVKYGVRTIGQLAQTDRNLLRQWFGKNGLTLYAFANGLDYSPVAANDAAAIVKSVGNSITAPHDLVTNEDVKLTIFILAESVAARLRSRAFGVRRCKSVSATTNCFAMNGKPLWTRRRARRCRLRARRLTSTSSTTRAESPSAALVCAGQGW